MSAVKRTIRGVTRNLLLLLQVVVVMPIASAAPIRGSWTDELEDVDPRHIDLWIGSFYAEGLKSEIEIAVGVSGLHAPEQEIHTTFELFLDTDNNSKTGSTFGSLWRGVDKVLEIALSGQYPFNGPDDSATSKLVDAASGTSIELTPPKVNRVYEIADTFESSVPPHSEASHDSIDQSIPLPLFGALADQVLVGVRAIDRDTGEFDQAVFVMGVNDRLDPYFKISPEAGVAGQHIALTGKRFSFTSPVNIFIDGSQVVKATSQSNGSFALSLVLPHLSEGDHLVMARDHAGLFDVRLFRVKPGQ